MTDALRDVVCLPSQDEAEVSDAVGWRAVAATALHSTWDSLIIGDLGRVRQLRQGYVEGGSGHHSTIGCLVVSNIGRDRQSYVEGGSGHHGRPTIGCLDVSDLGRVRQSRRGHPGHPGHHRSLDSLAISDLGRNRQGYVERKSGQRGLLDSLVISDLGVRQG